MAQAAKVEQVKAVFERAEEKLAPKAMVKVELPEDELPTAWYGINADLHKSGMRVPFPHGDGFKILADIFPASLVAQELSHDRWIQIPEEVLELYKMWRPTPLYRATRLEEFLKTPCRIYYKNEYVSPPGSHKPNTAVPQAWYNLHDGYEGLSTETGAGQWGSALAFGCSLAGIKCDVFMVRVSYYQKPGRRIMMESWGARCVPSPSVPPERTYPDMRTEAARKVLEKDPDSPGSLGIAISDAIEHALKKPYPLNYALGSVLNHVLLHQTIVGQEALKQFEVIDEYPDVLFGCTGGGSNYSGFTFPFTQDRLDKKRDTRFVACEAASCARYTNPKYVGHDYGDTGEFTPQLWMYTLGHDFVPPRIHAGGLRYHGNAPQLSALIHTKVHEAWAIPQSEVFQAGQIVSQTEGLMCAPESLHGWAGLIREALRCKGTGEPKILAVNNSGHGWLDVRGYDEYLKGKLEVTS